MGSSPHQGTSVLASLIVRVKNYTKRTNKQTMYWHIGLHLEQRNVETNKLNVSNTKAYPLRLPDPHQR